MKRQIESFSRGTNASRNKLPKMFWLVLVPLLVQLPGGAVAYGAEASGASQQIPAFFNDASAPSEGGLPDVPSLRERFVTVDLGLLRGELSSASRDRSRKVVFRLFDDVVVEVPTGNFEHRPHGFSWSGSGRTEDGVDQIAVVTVRDAGFGSFLGSTLESRPEGDSAMAEFWSGSKKYSLQGITGGLHVIYEVDTSLLRGDDEGGQGPAGASNDQGPSSATGAISVGGTPLSSVPLTLASITFVDILVVHTQAAGSTQPNIANWIQNQIDQGNEANNRSGIPFRFRLVHQSAVTYTETSNNIGLDLDRLRGTAGSDAYLNNVHTLREDYGADIVILAGRGWSSSSGCGMAYLMNSVNASFASSAFGLVDVDPGCALTFIHEVGHNMALRHDWANSDGIGSPFTYNHGYSSVTGNFRTILAYRPGGCVAGCPRIPNWSDPDVSYNLQPTGRADNGSNSQPADNARAIAQTYGTVASFRTVGSLGGSGSLDPSAVSWSAGRIDLFERGSDSALKHKWFNDGVWSGWEDLGGGLNSSPDVSSWGAGRLDVFVRGSDNALWHKYYNGTWSGWESLGGVLNSDPSAVSWGLNRIDVFVRGTDNALWRKSWDGTTWSGWDSLGGTLASGPDASTRGAGRLDVFTRGTNNEMWHKWYQGSWSGWNTLGGTLVGDPGAVSWGPARIDVFVRGTDNALWHKFWNGTIWLGWESVGGSYASGPDASSWPNGQLDVFVRGTDNTIIRRMFQG